MQSSRGMPLPSPCPAGDPAWMRATAFLRSSALGHCPFALRVSSSQWHYMVGFAVYEGSAQPQPMPYTSMSALMAAVPA